MSLYGFTPISSTFDNTSITAPIYQGVPTQITNTPAAAGGLFGWLDQVGAIAGNVAGRATSIVSEKWLAKLAKKNGPEKIPIVSSTVADNKLPVWKHSKFAQEAILFTVIIGGLAGIYFLLRGKK